MVAFGGRALSGEEPKYLNSPETPLYVKGQMLYALDVARIAMRERSRAIIVEGYLDCLMAHQHGFGETVAALGTAFTPAQLGLLRRYADHAQFIVITHQKRTMEAADVLYGVTMGNDGVSQIVSRRLPRDEEVAATA